jgi:hypothetical protein
MSILCAVLPRQSVNPFAGLQVRQAQQMSSLVARKKQELAAKVQRLQVGSLRFHLGSHVQMPRSAKHA